MDRYTQFLLRMFRKRKERKRVLYSKIEEFPFPHLYELNLENKIMIYYDQYEFVSCELCQEMVEKYLYSYTLENCRHKFCIDCLRGWIEVGDHGWVVLPQRCPQSDCEVTLGENDLDDFIKKTPIELSKKLQDNALKLNNWKCGWEEAKQKIEEILNDRNGSDWVYEVKYYSNLGEKEKRVLYKRIIKK